MNFRSQYEKLGRTGLMAKGIVYVLAGVLSAMAAFNLGGEVTGKRGVFNFILDQPYGQFLLGAMAVGLLAYVAWRALQAIADKENKGSDWKGIARRVGYGFAALLYSGLAVYAAKMALNGSSGGSGGTSRQSLVAKALSYSWGEILIYIIAAATALIAIRQAYKAFTASFKKHLDGSGMSPDRFNLLVNIGRAGYSARAVVLLVIAWLFVQAAAQSNPAEAGGTEEAFEFLRSSSYGPWVLGVIAAGLAAYGVFAMLRSIYFSTSR